VSAPPHAPLRFGALGCSSIAGRRTLPALRRLDGAQLTAVASRSVERAKSFAAEFDCLSTGYEDLLDREDVDAVYLSLPTGLHGEWAERVLLAGKHLLCEKPMTMSALDTRALAELAAERGLVLRENMTFVHHPQHAEVAALVAGGRIGTVRAFHAAFCIPPLPSGDTRYDPDLGGGALLDVGVYPLRAAQLLLGPGVAVAGATLRHDDELGVDLSGQILLVARNGALAHLEFGFQHAYHAQYSLWGNTARLSVDRVFTPPPSWRPLVRIDEQDHAEEISLAPADQFELSLSSFAAAVRADGGTPSGPEPNPVDLFVETAELVDAVRERAVRVPNHETAGY